MNKRKPKISKFITIDSVLNSLRESPKNARYKNDAQKFDTNLKLIIELIKQNFPDIDYLTSLIASITIFQNPSITSGNKRYSGIYYSIVLKPKKTYISNQIRLSPNIEDSVFENFLKNLYSSKNLQYTSSDTSYIIREHINKLFDVNDIHFQLFEAIKALIELGFFFITFDKQYSRFYIFNPSHITISYPDSDDDSEDSNTGRGVSNLTNKIFDYTKFITEVFQSEPANVDNRFLINSDATAYAQVNSLISNVFPGEILDEDERFDTSLFTPVKDVFGSNVKLITNEGVEIDINRTYIISSSTQLLFGESKYKKLFSYLQKIQILETANLIERLVKSKIFNLILVDVSKLDEDDIPYQLKVIENELMNHEISTSILNNGTTDTDLEKLSKNLAIIPVEGKDQIVIEQLKGEYKPIYYDIYYYWNKVYSILGIPPYYHANALEQIKSVPKEAIKIHDLNFSSNILKYQTIVNKFLKELLKAYFKNYFEIVWIDVALPPFTPPSKETETDLRNLKTFVDTIVELENLLGIQLKKEFILQYLFPEHSPEEIVENNETQKSVIEEIYQFDNSDNDSTGAKSDSNQDESGLVNEVADSKDSSDSSSSILDKLKEYANLQTNSMINSKFLVNINSLKTVNNLDNLIVDIGFISF